MIRMNSVDIEFLKQIKKICDKHDLAFSELRFTISKLIEWIFGFYKFTRRETAMEKARALSESGYLTPTNKGFKFSEKAQEVIK